MTATPQQRIERRMKAFVTECDQHKRSRPNGRQLRDLQQRMVNAAERAERKTRD